MTRIFHQHLWRFAALVLLASTFGFAGYKARQWKPRALDSYPARQSSQGVTIAIDPLFRDPMAAMVFDKDDIVSRGIMPLAVVVFNDNDYAVQLNSATIELIQGDEHARTREPEEIVPMLFKKSGSKVPLPVPIPRGATSGSSGLEDPMADFDHKFLADKTIGPHSNAGGFLYFRVPQIKDLSAQLSKATLYIPDVLRTDNSTRLMYFEIELKPAIDAAAGK
jgi:hypothetical protein